MKHALILISILCFGAVAVMFAANVIKTKSNRTKRIELIKSYMDSVGVEQTRLFLLDHQNALADNLQARMAIKSKIWTWQWKVDSLKMTLNK